MGNSLGASSRYIPAENIPEDNGIRFLGKILPNEVLCHILSFVPAEDLVCSANRVCQYWNGLLSDNHFWFTKLHVEGIVLLASSRERFMNEDVSTVRRVLQTLSAHRLPLNENLLRNPSGVDGLNSWHVRHGGDRLIVESEPAGSDPIPEEAGLPTQHCFVTSYGICVRQQEVDLQKLGFSPLVMDVLKPKIVISEWVSARWDCRSESSLKVVLQGQTSENIELSWSSDDEGVVNRLWYELNEVLTDYPKGLRKIVYTSTGKDRQFWAGHYGAKTAGSSIKLTQ